MKREKNKTKKISKVSIGIRKKKKKKKRRKEKTVDEYM